MKKIFNSSSEDDTKELAIKVRGMVGEVNVICLYGELGAGKTTFVKTFAKALGVETRIISPTYTLIRIHKTKNDRKLFHIDAYRLSEEKDSYEIKEILERNNDIIVIEWADRVKSILPEKRIDIEFLYKKNNEREVRIEKRLG